VAHVERLKFQNFRRLEDTAVELGAAGVYLLLGPNGAGKSTVVGALKWLRDGLVGSGDSAWKGSLEEVGGYAATVTRGREGSPIRLDLHFVETIGELLPAGTSFGADATAVESLNAILTVELSAQQAVSARLRSDLHGHVKVPTDGRRRCPLVASGGIQWWPSESPHPQLN